MLGASQVEGHQGQPVDRVDAVGEEDESRLVKSIWRQCWKTEHEHLAKGATWALAGLEGVESCKDYEKEGEKQASHDFIFHAGAHQDLPGSLNQKR